MDEVLSTGWAHIKAWDDHVHGVEPLDFDAILDGYDAAVDFPVGATQIWSALFRERCPRTKVILTERDSPEVWADSYLATIGTLYDRFPFSLLKSVVPAPGATSASAGDAREPRAADRIFVSHLHGTIWGLPGVVVSALLEQRGRRHLHVYGPEGLHEYLSTTLSISGFAPPKSGSRCIVTELPSTLRRPPPRPLKPRSHPAVEYRAAEHVDGGASSTIVDDGAAATATPIRHTPAVDCFAFVVTEKAGKRRVDAAKATALGLPPATRTSGSRTATTHRWATALPAGRTALSAAAPRRVAILGDTYDASAAVDAARGADVVVHEATMADGDAAR
ncbi:proteasome-activating ATPase [Aureococcus anophagefferens]|nr:proteasome-activating ATPase [Aureococcus anophagefferens]